MGDLLLPEPGARPWMPAGNATTFETLHKYNIPLSGLIEQDGVTFLYACLVGELEELNVWAYSHVTAREVKRLTSLLGDDLAAATDAALMHRDVIVALAHDHELQFWLPIASGEDGPLQLAKLFIGDELRPRQTN
jgi:hypothetical protein